MPQGKSERPYIRNAATLAACLSLGGCGSPGAPSFILFGAYFPGWMFCAVAGILVGILARVTMVATGAAEVLPFQLFVCTAIGVIAGVGAWLVWFGR